ncbi:hypothetical protein F5B20DRAFT_593070 [Whalleya microplaca]|nr:hypothetical protein F5B20DRAFT_593070 [Whalleya microplaca]
MLVPSSRSRRSDGNARPSPSSSPPPPPRRPPPRLRRHSLSYWEEPGLGDNHSRAKQRQNQLVVRDRRRYIERDPESEREPIRRNERESDEILERRQKIDETMDYLERGLTHPHKSARQKVNGVWDPSQTTDITVHLNMPLQEDLDDNLEQFCRLQRFGDFASAKRYFSENLQEHIDKPYVFVHYAEMLLEQGDYKSLVALNDDIIYSLQGNVPDSDEEQLLREYWGLIRLFVYQHNPTLHPPSLDDTLNAIQNLHMIMCREGRIVGSTEIKMLALAYRIRSFWRLSERLHKFFPSRFHKKLYASLLQQGRIWDFRDIIVARMEVEDVFDVSKDLSSAESLRSRLGIVITDWSGAVGGYDTSTTLALLDILVCPVMDRGLYSLAPDLLSLSTPLASSIIANDRKSIKSRSFTKWMLTKADFAAEQDVGLGASHNLEKAESFPGVLSPGIDCQRLHIYVPVETENPGWVWPGATSKLKTPMEMGFKTSSMLDDYRTAAIALRQLIWRSAEPAKEFEELGNLQKDTIWTLSMLQYALEGEAPATESALERADKHYELLDFALKAEVDKKLPGVKLRVRRVDREPQLRHSTANSQREKDRSDVEQKILDAKRQYLEARQDDAFEARQDDVLEASSKGPDDFEITVKPHIIDGKKITILFEDVKNPADKQVMSYQLDDDESAQVGGPHSTGEYKLVPTGDRKGMKATRVHEVPHRDPGSKDARDDLHPEPTTMDSSAVHPPRSPTTELPPQRHDNSASRLPHKSTSQELGRARQMLILLKEAYMEESEENLSANTKDMSRRQYLDIAIESQRKAIEDLEKRNGKEIKDKVQDKAEQYTPVENHTKRGKQHDKGKEVHQYVEVEEVEEKDSGNGEIKPTSRRPTMPTVESTEDTGENKEETKSPMGQNT